jgi:hypothetical protein
VRDACHAWLWGLLPCCVSLSSSARCDTTVPLTHSVALGAALAINLHTGYACPPDCCATYSTERHTQVSLLFAAAQGRPVLITLAAARVTDR